MVNNTDYFKIPHNWVFVKMSFDFPHKGTAVMACYDVSIEKQN